MSFRKLLFILALFPTFACRGNYPSCEAPCYPAFGTNEGCNFSVYGDWLYWRARRCLLDFAAPTNLTTGFGDIYDVAPQYDNGFRVGVAANWCETLFEARYTYYRTSASNEVTAVPGTISGTRFNNNFMPAVDEIAFASGRWELKYDVVDILAGYTWERIPCFHPKVFGGFTFARIDQELDITYAEVDGPLADHLEETIDMKAYGVTLGLGASYDFWNCLSAFGDFSYNALLGDFNRGYKISDNSLGLVTTTVDFSDACWRMVSVFNLAFGLKYNYQFCGGCLNHLGLALGYEFHHWVNLDDFMDIDEDINFDRHIDSLGLDGLFLRLTIGF